MSIFGRRQDDARPRSAQEREQARLERERRRAAREGRPAPVAPPPADEPAWAPEESVEFDVPPVGVAEQPVHEAPQPPVGAEQPVQDEPQAPMEAGQPADDEWQAPVEAGQPADDVWQAPVEAEQPVSQEPEAPAVAEQPVEWASDDEVAWHQPASWDEAAAEHRPQPVAEAEAEPEPAGGPTLDEELAAVDRGWFDDAEDRDADEDQGQETVEWDVLANRSKARPQPPTGPAGVDTPTVEWDVMAEQPKAPVREEEPRFARTTALADDGELRASAATDTPDQQTSDAPGARAGIGRAAVTPRADRFGDAGERPVPTRRVTRATGRTLPPPPPAPGERRPRGRFPRRRALLLLVLVPLIAGAVYLANALFQPLAGEGGRTVRVDVPENATAGDIGDLLAERGIVDSAFFFTVRARLDGASLKAGEYTLKTDMPYGDAIKALSAGPPPPRTIKVTIPEGRARRETAPLVRDAGLDGSYLAATERSSSFNARRYGAPRRVNSLEGFLFPATYELEPGSTSRQLVRQQLAAFRENIGQVNMRRARARNLTTYDVLIIASMVEREATLDSERRQISAVIHNRLRQGMPLGIDATIRYATRNWTEPLKQSELAIDSPFNTRRRTGLPPTPIGSPGLASIKAAANPANVKHLFYVVKPCGNGAHSFSSTDAQFQRDVAAYNRKRDELGGKSPVDC
jgi:uncharacterized YceG family protein